MASPAPSRPTPVQLQATCGHLVDFLDEPGNRFNERRRDKVTTRKCRACRVAECETSDTAKIEAARRKRLQKRGLPVGTKITIVLSETGWWEAVGECGDIRISEQFDCPQSAGQYLTQKLKRALGMTTDGPCPPHDQPRLDNEPNPSKRPLRTRLKAKEESTKR